MSDEFDDAFAGLGPVGEEPATSEAPEEAPPADDMPADERAALEVALREAAGLPLNDYGNGQRFVLHFGCDKIFVPRVGWFHWSGKVWEKDEDMLKVRRSAQRLSELILREIPHLHLSKADSELLAQKRDLMARKSDLVAIPAGERSEEQSAELSGLEKSLTAIGRVEKALGERRNRHRSFSTTTGNSARIDNAMKEAGVELAVPFEDLDARPLDVNCESGVLRFRVDDSGVSHFEQVPHERDQHLTKMMPVKLKAGATCEKFDTFLSRVQPDREMRAFIQRWLGLSMTGVKMQRLVFFYGGGANGKSVLVDLMARIMGNYAATARIESLTGTNRRGGGDATPDLIPLMGARMVRTSEPDEGQRLQEGLIKELTGGEPIQVRALHSDFVEVRPIFKLTMSGNHKPDIRGTDDGIWRRVLLVPFDVQIPEGERDPDLGDKLWEERDGILNWLIDGLVDFLDGGLRPPEAVTAATREYREESDPIGLFLTTCCAITGDPSDVIASKTLGDAFNYHLIERGHSQWKPTTFARQIAVKARQWRHPHTGLQFDKSKASISQYQGIRFTDAFKHRFETAPTDHNGRPLGVSHAPDPDSEPDTGG